MGEIRLGPPNSETILPVLNWPSGSSPEVPMGTTNYVDKVTLADGSARYNFRTTSPRNWVLTWERLTAAEAATITAFESYNDVLHYQNTWHEPDWHWVIITDIACTPYAATFATGDIGADSFPFYKVTLSLEEILQGQATAPTPPASTNTVLTPSTVNIISFAATSPILQSAATGTVYAASPALADVLAAIAAASPGNWVIVPNGSATWPAQCPITKGIVLKAQSIGGVTITSGYTSSDNGTPAGALIPYSQDPAINAPFGIIGFNWDLNNKCMFLYLSNQTATPLTKTRIGRNHISNTPGRCIINDGTTYGVIDNNVFDIGVQALSSYGVNEVSWINMVFNFGSANNMYFEDNSVTTASVPHDGGSGGRYCCRYNTYVYTNNSTLWPNFDFHGNGQGPGYNNGAMGCELYENTWSSTQNRGLLIADCRGGRSLVYNNIMTAPAGCFLRYREEYIDTCVPPARGLDGEPQFPSDSYSWGNTDGTSLVVPTIDTTVDYSVGQTVNGVWYGPAWPYRVVPQFDLDVWKQVSPFTGATGMGVGLFANRPASCTLEGAAYWATDQRLLYRWHSEAWQLYYTPYTYPHPLRSDPTLGD